MLEFDDGNPTIKFYKTFGLDSQSAEFRYQMSIYSYTDSQVHCPGLGM